MRTKSLSDSQTWGPTVSSPVHCSAQITRYIINIPQTEAQTFFQGLQNERILKYEIFIQNSKVLWGEDKNNKETCS